ncbi:MAG: FMN-dependent NADH-azoreductase [Alphaproteobacteria bacterium]|nr:MAG: FMN-dependent NADH-azoreductase [Alphaproteobacteria bacterium]
MTHILALESSINGEASVSSGLARQLVDRLVESSPKAEVTRRNLVENELPHMGTDFMHGIFAEPEARTDSQRQLVALTERLISEIEDADTLVIAAPMYNFAIPSTLKAWFDHIALAGKTFRYTAEGPVGFLKGKKVYLVVSRGGDYSDPDMAAIDFQLPYLKHMLGFLGMTDVSVVTADGQDMSAERAKSGRAAAEAQIDALFANVVLAAE